MARPPGQPGSLRRLASASRGLSIALAVFLAAAASAETAPAEASAPALDAGDALELTVALDPRQAAVRPVFRAWLLKSDEEMPPPDRKPAGLVQAWPSATRPGTWLVHVRGVTPPEDGAAAPESWDVLLRWSNPDGERRFPGAVRFKRGAPDVVLLLDGSLSMGRNDPRLMRVEAARAFVHFARRSGGIGRVAVVQFSDNVVTLLPLTPVEQAGAFEAAFAKVRDNGQTDIDGSLRRALEIFAADNWHAGAAVVLLTDGKQEPGEYAGAHKKLGEAKIPVHTVALGSGADRALLQRIAEETGGTYSETHRDQDLLRLYASIAGQIVGGQTILTVPLAAGGQSAFPVDGSCETLTATVRAKGGGALVLTPPGGTAESTGAEGQPVYFRNAPQPGRWTAGWTSAEAGEVSLTVSARSALFPLFFRTSGGAGSSVEIDPDDPFVAVSLAEAVQAAPGAQVDVALERGGGAPAVRATLFDDGAHGDGEANDGVYAGALPELGDMPGDASGTIALTVAGTREGEEPFRREARARWTLRRWTGQALDAGGALDFGLRYAGEDLSAAIEFRVRGRGGSLQAALAAPADARQTDLSGHAGLVDVPAELRPRKPARASLHIELPPDLTPGVYGGTVEVTLVQGLAPTVARVPWRVDVRDAELAIEPQRLELGELAPGSEFVRRVRVKTGGGRLVLRYAELGTELGSFRNPWTAGLLEPALKPAPAFGLAGQPMNPLIVGPEGSEIELRFAAGPTARGGAYARPLRFYDSRGGLRGQTHVAARIAADWIEAGGLLDFERIEPGDAPALEATVLRPGWALAAGRALVGHPVYLDRTDVQAEWLPGAGPTGTLRLKVDPDAAGGEARGWIRFESSTALTLLPWRAEIVRPLLTLSPPALDFGGLMEGQTKHLAVEVAVHAARPVRLHAQVEAPPAKPLLPHIRLRDEALVARLPDEDTSPGATERVDVALNVPEFSQDGEYHAQVVIESRLGRRVVPATFHVVAPVPLPAFHVSPTEITVRVANGVPVAPVTLALVSHRDEEVRIAAAVESDPEASHGRACAELLRHGELPSAAMDLVLPAREETRVLVQAEPGARDGETCVVIFEGGGERLAVHVTVERDDAASGALAAHANAFFDWVRLLLFLLLMLLVLLVRAFTRRRWVRYATYAVAVHAALMLMAVPASEMVGALPTSVQVTLLESQENLGFELSPEQRERLDALKTGREEVVAERPLESAPSALAGAQPQAPKTEPKEGETGAPAAAAAKEEVKLPEARAEAQVREPERQRATPMRDEALAAEDLAPEPEPTPAPQEPAEEQRAPIREPVAMAQETPLAPPVEVVRDAPAHAAAQPTRRDTEPLDEPLAFAPASAAPPVAADARPTSEAPAAVDAPLAAEPVESEPALAAPVASDARPAPAPARPLAAPVSSSAAPRTKTMQAHAGSVAGEAEPTAGAKLSGALALAGGEALGEEGEKVAASSFGQRDARGLPFGEGSEGALDAAPVPGGGRLGSAPGGAKEQGGEAPAKPQGGAGGSGSLAAGLLSRNAGVSGGLERLASGGSARVQAGPDAAGHGLFEPSAVGDRERLAQAGGSAHGRGMLDTGGGDAPLKADGKGFSAGGTSTGPGSGQGVRDTGTGKAGGDAPGVPYGSGAFEGALGAGGQGKRLDGSLLAGGEKDPPRGSGGARHFGGMQSAQLERLAEAVTPSAGHDERRLGMRPQWGPVVGSILRVTLGLARHGGDWNSSPTALHHLATAFKERCGLPEVQVDVRTVSLDSVPALSACQLVLVTSNEPIPMRPAERAAMQAYVLGGGTLWINDSSASSDERFHAAMVRDLAEAFRNVPIQTIDVDHPLFRSAYDLSNGYKGFHIPPGDKYREEKIAGITVTARDGTARTGVLYTRNDYADGLEIDPRMSAGMRSLTDLTSDEMLEGSLRFGMNAIAYALGSQAPKMPPPPESTAHFEKIYRYHGPAIKPLDDFEQIVFADGEPVWRAAEWANPGKLGSASVGGNRALKVDFQGGDKHKAAVEREVNLDLGDAKAVVLDLHSSLTHGLNVSILFHTRDGSSYESRPVYVRPGWNRNLRFPLAQGDFKSSKNEWKAYDQPFEPRTGVLRLAVLFYNLNEDGAAMIDSLRIER